MFEVGDKVRWTEKACKSAGAMPDEVFEVLKVAADGSVWTTGRSYGIDPERLTLDEQIKKGMLVRISQKSDDGTSMVVTDVVKVINKGYINTEKYGAFSRTAFKVELISFPVPDKGRAVEFTEASTGVVLVGAMGETSARVVILNNLATSSYLFRTEIESGKFKWRYLT